MRRLSIRRIGAMALTTALAGATIAFLGVATPPARAADQPPDSPDPPAAMSAQSKLSAAIEIGLAAVDRALERKVPRRLATFDDRMTSCWHRRILGREVNVDCIYSGYVERSGPISLRAERGRLVAAAPVYGFVAGQGARRLAAMLHGTADGQMTVYAVARPRLRADWSVALDMEEGFRWEEPPVLTILGFQINLTRQVEPKIRAQLSRIGSEAQAEINALGLRAKAEAAWQRAFEAVKVVDAPEIWVRTTPQSIAFAGLHASGNVLEGSIELAGTTETFVGAAPAAAAPTPLPPLGTEVTEPGRFKIILPIDIDYAAIREKVAEAVKSSAQASGIGLRDLAIYPSDGKLVIGFRLATEAGQQGDPDGDWIYLTATPRVDSQTQAVQFPDLALTTTGAATLPPAIAGFLNDEPFRKALLEQARVRYQAEFEKALASVNARLSRPLGNGFRSEGHLAGAGVAGVHMLADRLRIDLFAEGQLKILYGL
jgi:hypothetical protein